MTAAAAQPAGLVLPTRKRKNVAVIGFTQHGYEAPWKDPDWDFMGLNDLHQVFERYMPGCFKTDQVQWFQLHHKQADDQYPGARDPTHTAWLKQQTCPIWMWAPDPEIPASLAYPIREVLNLRHPVTGGVLCPERYFNNSISWMIALAIYMGYERIGIYGVDMAMDGIHGESEYGWQRPSVEFWIGVARGLGITVTMPEVSEVLKCGYLYGYDNASHLRAKLLKRHEDLQQAEQEDVHAYEASKRLLFQTKGGLMMLTGLGVSSDVLLDCIRSIPEDKRQKAIALLEQDEMNVTNDHQAAERAMHEARGALNNLKWLLKNYLPGDGALQDVPRTERSLTLADIAPGVAPSDGGQTVTAPGGINRILALEGAREAATVSAAQGGAEAPEAGSLAPGLPGPEAQAAGALRLEGVDREDHGSRGKAAGRKRRQGA
jgi:hypothetical protein